MAEIFFKPKATKEFKSASASEKLKIATIVNILRRNSFPPHTKKLSGHDSGYRTRIGRWRVLFVLENNQIDVVDIFIKKGGGDYRKRT